MPGQGTRKRFALDSNVLIDLAGEEDYAQTFREVFQERGYSLWLPPTVAHELLHAAETKPEPDGPLARSALAHLLDWQIFPLGLTSVDRGIADVFARRMAESGLLPPEEYNDGLILAETSLAEVPVLVSSDHHLLDIPEDRLLVCFNDADLPPVRVAHPKGLLRAVR
jgi:predicted nucleic acid-binding protein